MTMPKLTSDQVKGMAPDPASLKAGQGLANLRHWSNLGGNGRGLWGECQGSGKKPYQVRIDLSNLGYACTCPSRKFPCKHVLGLLFLAAGSSAELTRAEEPAWFAEWLAKRGARQEAAAKRISSKPKPETRQRDAYRRAAKREELAETGIDALEQWLKDFTRFGLAYAQSAPTSFWEDQAARMVDCQIPGAARLIREMRALPGSRKDWAERLLLSLGRLYLLAQAFRKLDSLPEATRQEVRSLLGWTIKQEELIASQPAIRDDWLVLASSTAVDEKTGLRTQINWLWGKAISHPAQIINYAHRSQPLDNSLQPGLLIEGDLVYFPGEVPLRAVFKGKRVSGDVFIPGGHPNLDSFLLDYAMTLGKNPWLEIFPVMLDEVIPVKIEQNWLLCDRQNRALPLAEGFSSPWELLAVSGGYPLTIFGLWDGFALTPACTWQEGRFLSL
jgi:hypothetical protein